MVKVVKKRMQAAIAAIASFSVFGVAYANAQSQPVNLVDPLGGNETFLSVVNNVAGFLFTDIAIPLATIMVLVGAFQFMTGGGNPEKISKARKTILYAAIGFAVALIASGVSSIIKSILTGSS